MEEEIFASIFTTDDIREIPALEKLSQIDVSEEAL